MTTSYHGTAELGDEMTATVSIDDIDGYAWTGNIQKGEGHKPLVAGVLRVTLTDGEHAGKSAEAELGYDAFGEIHLAGAHPFTLGS